MRTQLQEWLTCSFEEVPISHLCYDLLLWTWLIYLAGGTQKQPFILLSSFLEPCHYFLTWTGFLFFSKRKISLRYLLMKHFHLIYDFCLTLMFQSVDVKIVKMYKKLLIMITVSVQRYLCWPSNSTQIIHLHILLCKRITQPFISSH